MVADKPPIAGVGPPRPPRPGDARLTRGIHSQESERSACSRLSPSPTRTRQDVSGPQESRYVRGAVNPDPDLAHRPRFASRTLMLNGDGSRMGDAYAHGGARFSTIQHGRGSALSDRTAHISARPKTTLVQNCPFLSAVRRRCAYVHAFRLLALRAVGVLCIGTPHVGTRVVSSPALLLLRIIVGE